MVATLVAYEMKMPIEDAPVALATPPSAEALATDVGGVVDGRTGVAEGVGADRGSDAVDGAGTGRGGDIAVAVDGREAAVDPQARRGSFAASGGGGGGGAVVEDGGHVPVHERAGGNRIAGGG